MRIKVVVMVTSLHFCPGFSKINEKKECMVLSNKKFAVPCMASSTLAKSGTSRNNQADQLSALRGK